MKIVNIVPGFGGSFYCGNCLRDSAYVNSLKELGHDSVTLPMYLPLTLDGENTNEDVPVFYGAVNIYLKQQFPIFRHIPGWLEHLFDSKPLLKFAAKKSGSTRAHGLEELTESMLLGQHGHQNQELARLVDYLKNHEKPDVVHFSNALLLGMASQIREEVNVPVVFSLQDEDVWVDAMDAAWREKIWQLMAAKSVDVDAFISVSSWFAGIMQEKLHIPHEKMHVVHIGIQPEEYRWSEPAVSPRAIGYLSRICEDNGFEVLVDAFILIKQDTGFRDLKLIATGGMTGDDLPFFRHQKKKLQEKNLLQDVEILPDFGMPALHDFFRSLSVLSVPVLKGEAFGRYQIEALASGVPLVQPELGAFPEIIEASGGGTIYRPNTAEALASKLAEVLSDPGRLAEMSRTGRKSVEDSFDCRKLTLNMIRVYESVIRASW